MAEGEPDKGTMVGREDGKQVAMPGQRSPNTIKTKTFTLWFVSSRPFVLLNR